MSGVTLSTAERNAAEPFWLGGNENARLNVSLAQFPYAGGGQMGAAALKQEIMTKEPGFSGQAPDAPSARPEDRADIAAESADLVADVTDWGLNRGLPRNAAAAIQEGMRLALIGQVDAAQSALATAGLSPQAINNTIQNLAFRLLPAA